MRKDIGLPALRDWFWWAAPKDGKWKESFFSQPGEICMVVQSRQLTHYFQPSSKYLVEVACPFGICYGSEDVNDWTDLWVKVSEDRNPGAQDT